MTDGVEGSCMCTGRQYPDPQGWLRVEHGYICPACKGHAGGAVGEVLDCKNITVIEGRTVQCVCYSIEHGKRDRR